MASDDMMVSSAYGSDLDRAVLCEFIDESQDMLRDIENLLLAAEQNPRDLGLINQIFRPAHSIKGNSAFFGLMRIKELAHALESVLDKIRKSSLAINAAMIQELLAGFDALMLMFARVREGQPEVADDDDFRSTVTKLEELAKTERREPQEEIWGSLVDKLDRVVRKLDLSDREAMVEVESLLSQMRQASVSPPAEQASKTVLEPTSEQQKTEARSEPTLNLRAADGKERDKTMRVQESQIDEFLGYVGELIVVGEMFGHLQQRLHGDRREVESDFRRVNETFSSLSSSLQRSIMALRMIPMQKLLDRAPRLVRDVAQASGKQIEVRLQGGDVMADKHLLEVLDAPFTHLIRNAADHGIEMPEDRKSAGKGESGTIEVMVRHVGPMIELVVRDDGRGLNEPAIRKKAVDMGLLTEGDALDRETLVDLLFQSGVSSAETISDISGRGVGLDVVKSQVNQNGGRIDVSYEEGKGTEFVIALNSAVTTQILAGFLVLVGPETFVLPMEKVHEASRITQDEVTDVARRGRCVQRHGELLPLIDLRMVFGSPSSGGEVEADAELLIVSVLVGGHDYALVVDEVPGVQQVVVKPIDGVNGMPEWFTGGALTGDGTVALVLDLDALIKDIALG